jgi:hypothetical protein
MNPLLRAIPKGIKIARNADVHAHFQWHTAMVGVTTLSLIGYVMSIPFSIMPITFFGGEASDYRVSVDYASGELVTETRKKLRFVENI